MNPRKWRKDGVKSKNGTSWRLMTGRDDTRESIGLGMVTEEQADRCLATLQREENETAGTERAGRLQRLAAEPDGKARVVRYLLGDPAPAFGPEVVNQGATRLDAYVGNVWGPERAKQTADTWKREEYLWNSYILPALGAVRVRDLDHVGFDSFIGAVTKRDGQPASWNTKRLIRAAYQACLTHAERKGHIPQMHRFYQLKGSGTVLPKAQPLDSAEIVALVRAARSPTYAALFGLSFESGARPGEVGRVHWEDIDWTETERCPHGKITIRGTKTAAAKRTIPLFNLSRELLEVLWDSEGRPTEGLVFVTDKGAAFASWKRALKTAATRAGITDRRIFPYLGRHTALTAAMDSGASKEETAALAGHTDVRMVGEVYDHGAVTDRVNVAHFPRRTATG